jgi:hypothetical protein
LSNSSWFPSSENTYFFKHLISFQQKEFRREKLFKITGQGRDGDDT